MKAGPIKLTLLLLVSLLCAFIAYHYAPKDRNGNRPRDAASGFIEAVNAGNQRAARRYWSASSIVNAEKNFSTNFDDLCVRLFSCDGGYELERTRRQKEGLFSVGFRGQDRGGIKTYHLYFRRVDGVWLITEDLWIK